MEIVKVKKISKNYGKGENKVKALNNINLSIKKGEFIGIIGPSGSGKSTFLNILGGIDRPDEGEVIINNTDIVKLNTDKLAQFRRDNIGFIFQFYNLLPAMTVKENIILPASLAGKKPNNYEKLVNSLKIKDKENYLPNDLSGGQRQRVAIARALINKPKILLADEPTGNLDSKTAKKIMSLLKYYNSLGQTIIFVTHDLTLARQTKRIITIKDGQVVKDVKNEKFNN